MSLTHVGLSTSCFMSVESRRRAARMTTRSSGVIPLCESLSSMGFLSVTAPVFSLSRSGPFQASAMMGVSSLPERLLSLRSFKAARPTSRLADASSRLASNAHRARGHQCDGGQHASRCQRCRPLRQSAAAARASGSSRGGRHRGLRRAALGPQQSATLGVPSVDDDVDTAR